MASGCNLTSVIDKGTAALTNDYEAQSVIQAPQGVRCFMRCIVSLAVLGLLASAVIFLYQNQPNTKLSRIQLDVKCQGPVYPPLPPGTSVPSGGNVTSSIIDKICPCSNPSFSWSSFITFYEFYLDPQGVLMQSSLDKTITSIPFMCQSTDSTYIMINVCKAQIRGIITITDTRTFIPSPSLLPPISLYNTIQQQMLTSVGIQNENFQYLNTNEQSKEYSYAVFLYYLVQTMIAQQMRNTTFSPYDNWISTKATLNNMESLFKFTEGGFDTNKALGMYVDYDAYVHECNAKYCDVMSFLSTPSKVYYAISVVGGFLSIILFIVRSGIWPIICTIFCFPRSD